MENNYHYFTYQFLFKSLFAIFHNPDIVIPNITFVFTQFFFFPNKLINKTIFLI